MTALPIHCKFYFQYFIHTVLPVAMSKMDVILEANGAILDIPDVSFGG